MLTRSSFASFSSSSSPTNQPTSMDSSMDTKDLRRSQYAHGRLPSFQNKTRGARHLTRITKTSALEDRFHLMDSYGAPSATALLADQAEARDLFSALPSRDARTQRHARDLSRRRRHDLRSEMRAW